jgi:shikimate kinase
VTPPGSDDLSVADTTPLVQAADAPVFLIGLRGTGKTTVARILGLRLGWDWVDADVEVELRAGKSIKAIFADNGEPAFRDLEGVVLADLVRRRRTIAACGGGVIIRAPHRELLAAQPRVVWLRGVPEVLHERIQADQSTAARRPSLTPFSALDEIRRLAAEREPWYRSCAKFELDAGRLTPDECADGIIAEFGLTAGRGAS